MNELIANRTWNNFHWPEWVPAEVKKQIMSCYAEAWGEGPASWLEGAIRNRAPIFGDRVRVTGFRDQVLEGRLVFAWNEIGRIVTDDEGHYECAGFSGFEVSRNGLEPCDYSQYDNTIAIGLSKYAVNGVAS